MLHYKLDRSDRFGAAGLVAGAAVLALASAALSAAQAPAAHACSITIDPVATVQCGRPNTPTNPYLSADVGGALFSFTNTDSGPVVFDFDETREGQRVRPSNVTCALRFDNSCPLANTNPYYDGEQGQPTTYVGTLDFFLVQLDPGARYCLRIRSRNWNEGDPQDGLVSGSWSDWTCAVRPPGSAPAPASEPAPAPEPPRAAAPAQPAAP